MENLVRITRIRRETFYQNLIEQNERKKARVMEPQLPLLSLSKYVGDRLATPKDAPVPDCVTCGACCAYLLFVPVTAEDSERLSEFVELTLDECEAEIAVDRVLPREAGSGHCINLVGVPGESVGCTVYADRPRVCRDFEAGSDRCHEYRRLYGFEPRLDESELAAALVRIENAERKERIVHARILQESAVSSFSFSVGEPETAVASESVQLKIVAFLEDDETPYELHRFDPAEEIWFETDLITLSLAQAKELIASRTQEQV